ncbi:resolvase [Paenibacillus phage Yyerffej]|uniref:Resolvase n=14 Tax=root TaxID=1 RepID=A0A345ATA7_9CAUD|nr:RuvC-like Holliday junction resolvase [Paenibacillus phage Yyerffej]YP_009838830.1 RuvC-like Holliday junction resolvase [Paenibacillus phage Lucielle]YP_009838897.1 RuvC-like Holliday junction resolvase [Paenibacillus phage Eltigre]AXF40498.1 resolvase [Paenibacillus phage Saudage]AXF39549.1 resolvase [Paenibacillus phage Yyerffej]AXF39753.1 resolvase [Paenibacillus phage Lucielle]AXF40140.1 resolvase [Paenibacillus phage Eltigre]
MEPGKPKRGESMRFVGIDPSTKTGFVALDQLGKVSKAKELTGINKSDSIRIITLVDEIMDHIQPGDRVFIEGFAHAAKGNYVSQMFGIGWGIRTALTRRKVPYTEVTPSQLKKFATGKGNAKKEDLILPIYQDWGFENSSDNVRDAFILAHIAYETHLLKNGFCSAVGIDIYPYRKKIINEILNSPEKKKRRKVAR